MEDLFAMTADINDKPIPHWQARLEAMYTDHVPFGEILGFVRYLLEERDINAILNAPDDVILADFEARGGDIGQFAAEMRQRFDVISGLVREVELLRAVYNVIQARRRLRDFCLCGFRGPSFHGGSCPVAAVEALDARGEAA